MMHTTITTALGLAVLILAPCPGAQDPGDQTPNLVFEAGEHEIEAIIDRAARYLKRNYLIDAKSLEACHPTEIQLQNPLALNLSNCEDTVSQLAFTCGLALVVTDPDLQVYEWIALQGAGSRRIASSALSLSEDEVLKRRRSKIRVVTAIGVQFSDATQLMNTMRPIFSMTNQAMAFSSAGNSTIVVNGYADEVAAVIDLVRRADRPAVMRPVEQPRFLAPAQVFEASPQDYVSTLVPVQHLDPAAAASAVAGVISSRMQTAQHAGMSPPGPFRASALGCAVLLSGRQGQVAVAIRLLRTGDVPDAEGASAPAAQLRALAERITALEKAQPK